MNKEILFEDIKCGNLSAFEALFRQYYPSMCVIAGKLVANREVAEDIVQDVFIRLWEKKAEYDKIPDFFIHSRCTTFTDEAKNNNQFQTSGYLKPRYQH